MNYKSLTESDKAFIRKIHKEKKSEVRDRIISEYFDTSIRSVHNWVKKMGLAKGSEPINDTLEAAKKRELKPSKTYFITSAQNATPVHIPFFNNLLKYAEKRGAEVLVIPYRYKNPTSNFSDKEHDTWEALIHPYLILNRRNICEGLDLLCDIKIQPTASNPLQGFEGITGQNSAIIAHPRMAAKSLPVVFGNPVKALYTTGACTVENYTDSKAGKLGEFHHVIGFAIVEVRDDGYTVRQVSATSNGDFDDVMTSVTEECIFKNERIKALVLGDLHAFAANKARFNHTIMELSKLNPEKLVLHDIADGISCNPHESNNHILQAQRHAKGKAVTVSAELKDLKNKLQTIKDAFPQSEIIVVKSNHDEFFDRWINTGCWKKEYANSKTYLSLASISIRSDNGIIPYLVAKWFVGAIKCLKYNESYKIEGIEISLHGHAGNNGAKGSIMQFRNLSTKLITAHNHGFAIIDGVYQVGTCTDRFQSYNKGASSSAWADCIITNNGKRQLLIWS